MKKIISLIMSLVIVSTVSIFSVSADDEEPTEVVTETVTEKNTEEKSTEVFTVDSTEVDPTESTEATTEETGIEKINTSLNYQYTIILLMFVVLVFILCVQLLK